MLKITVELWPHGVKEARRELASMVISNDGSGTVEIGNYDVRLYEPGEFEQAYFVEHRVGPAKAHVESWKRLERPLWSLVRKAISACKL